MKRRQERFHRPKPKTICRDLCPQHYQHIAITRNSWRLPRSTKLSHQLFKLVLDRNQYQPPGWFLFSHQYKRHSSKQWWPSQLKIVRWEANKPRLYFKNNNSSNSMFNLVMEQLGNPKLWVERRYNSVLKNNICWFNLLNSNWTQVYPLWPKFKDPRSS